MKPNNPIEHVVIIVKENHSFDNYFGTFPGANGVTLPPAPDPPAHDPAHDHAAWLNRAKTAVQLQYKETNIPGYFALARQFTLCDNYFTEVASQSAPNHLMLISAGAPIIDDPSQSRTYQPQPPYDLPSLPASLAKAGLTWGAYGPHTTYFSDITALRGSPNIALAAAFDTAITAGKLPNVSWLYAPATPVELSEHPTSSVKAGMQWTLARVHALGNSQYWATCAIFITWDDWGGWYDHVSPPQKDLWTGQGPAHGPSYTNTQYSYGPRVGCLVISPYSKPGISTAFHSHVSLLRFSETTFGLPPLNARDAASEDMSDCFDFTQTPLAPPA
jgi:phospholipase C